MFALSLAIYKISAKQIVMFALSLAIYKISAKQIKCQMSDIENEGQGENRTCAI